MKILFSLLTDNISIVTFRLDTKDIENIGDSYKNHFDSNTPMFNQTKKEGSKLCRIKVTPAKILGLWKLTISLGLDSEILSAVSLSYGCGHAAETSIFRNSKGEIRTLVVAKDRVVRAKMLNIECTFVKNRIVSLEDYTMLKQPRNELGKLLKNGNFADFTLVVDETEIKAHKVILASSSKYFEAMLSSEMLEPKTGRLELRGTKLDIVWAMIEYMYTGAIRKPDSKSSDLEKSECVTHLTGLLLAADMYQVDDLKYNCERILCKLISKDSSDNLMALAIDHKLDGLREHVARFMVGQYEQRDWEDWSE